MSYTDFIIKQQEDTGVSLLYLFKAFNYFKTICLPYSWVRQNKMRRSTIHLILVLVWAVPTLASHSHIIETQHPQQPVDSTPAVLFCQFIPSIAEQFIGIPVLVGGRPEQTGSTDNSWLFYSIYAGAAIKAGLIYKTFMPMNLLLDNTHSIKANDVQNGDLIVLNNDLAAMVYQVDPSRRMHFIYASKKRGEVITFNSDNLVYHAYWLEHFKGFFRINEDMLMPARPK
nr:peptidoglycan endopeptidase [uncultured Desulfobacter sp.]